MTKDSRESGVSTINSELSNWNFPTASANCLFYQASTPLRRPLMEEERKRIAVVGTG